MSMYLSTVSIYMCVFVHVQPLTVIYDACCHGYSSGSGSGWCSEIPNFSPCSTLSVTCREREREDYCNPSLFLSLFNHTFIQSGLS